MNIGEYSVESKVISWLLVVILVGGGIWGFQSMGKLEDPAFTIKQAKVITRYPGATAQQVQDEVTYHIEEAIQLMGQVEEIDMTISRPGMSDIKIEFKNTSTQVPQPHNIVFCKPGKEGAVSAAAQALMTDPNAMAKGYIPDSPDIFLHSKLLQPNQSETIEFTAPDPGSYPYLCTFPGHWILMKGVMTVE